MSLLIGIKNMFQKGIVKEEPIENIKLVPVSEISGMLDTQLKLNVKLLEEGCKICKIPFLGGGVVFCKASPDLNVEMENLKKVLSKMLSKDQSYVFTYVKEERNHPTLAYYTVLGIRSSDILDLKKALKIHKLKAFL